MGIWWPCQTGPLPSVGELFFSPIPPNIPMELNLEIARTAFPVFCRAEIQKYIFPSRKQRKKKLTLEIVSDFLSLCLSSRQKQHGRIETSNLPSAPQYILLHTFFGELLGFHVLGVLFKPFVLQALCTGQSGSEA